jgi:hypothetical protein
MRRALCMALALVLVSAVLLAAVPSASRAQEETATPVSDEGIFYTSLGGAGPDQERRLELYQFEFQGSEPVLNIATPEQMLIYVESGSFFFEIDQGEALVVDPNGKPWTIVPKTPEQKHTDAGVFLEKGWTIHLYGDDTICFWCLVNARSGQLQVSVLSSTGDGQFSWTAVTKPKASATTGTDAAAYRQEEVKNLRSLIPLRNPGCQGRT